MVGPGAGNDTEYIVNWLHSPEYKYLYISEGGAKREVLRFRVADGKSETIASLKDLAKLQVRTGIPKSVSPPTDRQFLAATSARKKSTRSP